MACKHTDITLINPYELIRKYKCSKCGGVMMCECEKEFALRFFPHQITFATELDTQEIMPVTLGFQKSVCNKCRNIQEVAYPKSQTSGRTTLVRRYYWREIQFEAVKRFAEWLGGASYPEWLNQMFKHKKEYRAIVREVASEFQKLHKQRPKYVYAETPQEDVIGKYKVDIIDLFGNYQKSKGRKVSIAEGDELYSAESFAANHFIKQGYKVRHLYTCQMLLKSSTLDEAIFQNQPLLHLLYQLVFQSILQRVASFYSWESFFILKCNTSVFTR